MILAFCCPFSQGCSQGSTLSPLEKSYIYIYIFKIYLFWLWWVFVAACRLSLATVSGRYSSHSVWTFHCCGFFCCKAWVLESGSVVVALALVVLWHVGSSWTRDRSGVLCIARCILNHWITRKVQRTIL